MTKPLVFDTLEYSNALAQGGVSHPNVHAASLAEAVTQNIYVKHEVNSMIEAALKRFDERTHQMQLEMKEIHQKIIETNNKTVYRLTLNLGVIMTILTGIGTVLHIAIS